MSASSDSPYSADQAASSQTKQAWTVRRLLEWTTDFFRRNGLSPARLDAEVLLANVLQWKRLDLYLHYEDTISNDFLTTYRQVIQRRKKFEPVAYITGHQEFFSIPFSVNPSVLIPRPETEHLVEYALKYVAGNPSLRTSGPLKILDVGTGSGNLSITLAKHLSESWIVAIDISIAALSTAKGNKQVFGDLPGNIFFLQGDLLSSLHPGSARFHIIISNPPYIADEDWDKLPPTVQQYEPRVALNGGRGGTEILEQILNNAGDFLFDEGILIMEIGEEQKDMVEAMTRATGLYQAPSILLDYAGKPRVLVAKKLSS